LLCHTPVGILLLTIILLSGCSTSGSGPSSAADPLSSMESWMNTELKARPAAGAGFVPMEELTKDPAFPFDKGWIKEGVEWARYRTVYIAPVNTEYFKRADWWQETFRAETMQEDVKNLATFMRIQFMIAFQDDPQHRFTVVTSPEKDSLTMALALTELVPSHVMLNFLKMAAPFFSGVAVAALERGTEAQSTVSFEARLNDTNTGQTLAMFADRQHATAKLIDLQGLTWYEHAESIIKQWAKKFVEIADRQAGGL
jgi:hypothetical protein